jgi:hypothetical protein
MHQEKGVDTIAGMIRDDIRHALEHHDRQHAATLLATLRHFIAEHGNP